MLNCFNTNTIKFLYTCFTFSFIFFYTTLIAQTGSVTGSVTDANTLGRGLEDYSRFNTLRLGNLSTSDVRLDKKWNFRKLTLDLYLDVTNWWAAKTPAIDSYTFKRNATNTAFETTDGEALQPDGSNAIPIRLINSDAFVLPTIGFIVEF